MGAKLMKRQEAVKIKDLRQLSLSLEM